MLLGALPLLKKQRMIGFCFYTPIRARGTVADSAPDAQRIASKQLEDQVSLMKSLGLSPDHVHNSLRRLAMLGDRGRSSHVNEALLNFLGAPRSVSAATFDSHVPAANPATVPAQHFGWLLSE